MIYAIIGARGGSAYRGKNLKKINRIPLLAWPINTAKKCHFDGVYFSSDDELYLDIAKQWGATVVKRPAKLATDTAPDIIWIKHLMESFDKTPDLMILLRPTTPLRDPVVVQKGIKFITHYMDSLRSVQELCEPIEKMAHLTKSFKFMGKEFEKMNAPRQGYKTAYHPNGYFEILRPLVIEKTDTLFGKNVYGYLTPKTIEIDDEEDYEMVKLLALRKGFLNGQ